MSEISSLLRGINTPVEAAYHYFHAINIRVRQNLNWADLQFLQQNSDYADVKRGNYIPGFGVDVLVITNPNPSALRRLAELPDAVVNRLEIAVDLICDANTKYLLRDAFDGHFIQSWHGGQVQKRFDGGSYSRRYGRRQFVWYCDYHSKVTGELDCFHVEGRYWGMRAVRAVGIERPRDLLTFDHAAFWRKNLNLFEVESERLGRLYLNRLHRERRRHPLLHHTRNGFVYNIDRSTGNTLYHVLSVHPDQTDPLQCQRSTQCFVDRYGRGAFLQRAHYDIINVAKSNLPKLTPPHRDFFPLSPDNSLPSSM